MRPLLVGMPILHTLVVTCSLLQQFPETPTRTPADEPARIRLAAPFVGLWIDEHADLGGVV
ncbi:MAG: hypothetical protein KDC98_00170, partial [Planctomycetes bacterium]|nr:hypothetical protein [Planctomycetota bacterium]